MNETKLGTVSQQSVQAAETDMERQISEYCQKNMGACSNDCPKCIAHLLAHKGFRRNLYVHELPHEVAYDPAMLRADYGISTDEVADVLEKLLSKGEFKGIL